MRSDSPFASHIQRQQGTDKLFERATAVFTSQPFVPHRIFQGGHAQTLAAFAWPRRRPLQLLAAGDETRLFRVADDTQVLAHCRWQSNRQDHPTLVLWHGIEGSSSGVYMLATATKAFRRGFNVLRMNLRNCGDTERLTPTLYHGGLTEDLHAVTTELIEFDKLPRLVLAGFSLGGNMVLKLAGELGDDMPPEICAVAALSPSVSLEASAAEICKRSNWLYHHDFVRRLKGRIRKKHELFPSLYDISNLARVKTIREFDERFTAPAHGFESASDYYQKASSLPLLKNISVPTLIIHAEDDPFIPFAPLGTATLQENPNILFVATKQGGHLGFLSNHTDGEDRFWAENRVVDFCTLAVERA